MDDEFPSDEPTRIEMIARMGLDLLSILADRFRREMGREYDRIWNECLARLEGFNQAIFEGLHPDRESLDLNVTVLKSRYREFDGTKDEGMMIEGFLVLLRDLTVSLRGLLGDGPVKQALQEAIERLAMVEKYQKEPMMAWAMLSGLLEDQAP